MTGSAPERAAPSILNLSIAVSAIVMLGGLAGAVVAAWKWNMSGVGACLLAAGVAAGLVQNAVLRR